MSRTRAPKPSRVAKNTSIKFGKVTINVALYAGTEATKPKRLEFTGVRKPSTVGRVPSNKANDTRVKPSRVYRTAVASDGTRVRVSDTEVAAIYTKVGPQAPYALEQVVDRDQLGVDYFPDKTYQIRAAKGPNQAEDEANLAVLLKTLQLTDGLALVKLPLATNAAPTPCLINGAGFLFSVHFSDGVREALPLPEGEASQKVRAAAIREVLSLGQRQVPTVDTSGELLQQYIDDKAASGIGVVKSRAKSPAKQKAGV